MSDFNFTVDTSPMANAIDGVSKGVSVTTGAVVAMKAAVLDAEEKASDQVCNQLNEGFYSLMHAQISQKIAELKSSVETELWELVQYAQSLQAIQARMTTDYNLISRRYIKLFSSINNNLHARIAELDVPVFSLVKRDAKLMDNRAYLNSAQISTNQLESILTSQTLLASRVKENAEQTLHAISRYVRETALEAQKSEASMDRTKVESVEELLIPISIVESTTAIGEPAINYYVAKSDNESIDRKIDSSVHDHSINAVLHGSWSEGDPSERERVDTEFRQLLADRDEDPRVKEEISKMFQRAQSIQQLDSEGYEL